MLEVWLVNCMVQLIGLNQGRWFLYFRASSHLKYVNVHQDSLKGGHKYFTNSKQYFLPTTYLL